MVKIIKIKRKIDRGDKEASDNFSKLSLGMVAIRDYEYPELRNVFFTKYNPNKPQLIPIEFIPLSEETSKLLTQIYKPL